jgi:hypothetical protein
MANYKAKKKWIFKWTVPRKKYKIETVEFDEVLPLGVLRPKSLEKVSRPIEKAVRIVLPDLF